MTDSRPPVRAVETSTCPRESQFPRAVHILSHQVLTYNYRKTWATWDFDPHVTPDGWGMLWLRLRCCS